jgi:phosphomevalonate kinase
MPEVLEGVLLDSQFYESEFRKQLRGVVGLEWAMDVRPFELTSALRVVMGDVSAGSATPSMVRSVLKWKAGGEGAKAVWEKLGSSNRRLIENFDQLKEFESADIIEELRLGLRRPRDSSRPQIHQALEDISRQFEVNPVPVQF